MNDAIPDSSDQDTAEVALSVPLRTICYIAERTHDLMGKSASTESDTLLSDDDPEADILEDRRRDAVEEELVSLIEDLDVDAQVDLVALMWLGREDEIESWTSLRKLAWQERTPSPAAYLLGTPFLGDYLLAGLNQLGLSCEDSD